MTLSNYTIMEVRNGYFRALKTISGFKRTLLTISTLGIWWAAKKFQESEYGVPMNLEMVGLSEDDGFGGTVDYYLFETREKALEACKKDFNYCPKPVETPAFYPVKTKDLY